MFGSKRRAARDFVAWAGEHAICFDSCEEAASSSRERLAPLDTLIDGRRIVYLGECHHFIREKYAYRLLFLRWLHARGFRAVGEELAWSDGARVARYVASGEDRELDLVGTYGYQGGKRSDRDDEPTGVLAEIGVQPVSEHAAAQRRFAAELRGFVPLDFFGLDVDYEPGVGCERLAESSREIESEEPELAARLLRVPGESLVEEIARMKGAESTISQHAGALPRALHRDVRSVRQGLEYVALAHPAATYDDLRPAMALREEVMVEQVEHVLGESGGRRVVLMAHNQHLARRDDRIAGPRGAVGPGGGRVASLGTALARRHPGEVFAVWMLQDSGRDGRPLPGTTGEIVSVPGSLNALLAEVGDVFALPVAEASHGSRWLDGPVDVISLYGQRLRLRVREQVDVIFFVREVSALA